MIHESSIYDGESWFDSPKMLIFPYTSEIVSWCMEHGAITVFVSWCMVQSLFEQNDGKKEEEEHNWRLIDLSATPQVKIELNYAFIKWDLKFGLW